MCEICLQFAVLSHKLTKIKLWNLAYFGLVCNIDEFSRTESVINRVGPWLQFYSYN